MSDSSSPTSDLPSSNSLSTHFHNTAESAERLRDHILKPIADRFGFPLSRRGGQSSTVPTVLCLGNHSSGKSSFINHWIGASIQTTGVAPTDDGFTILMYGSAQLELDGRTAVVDPQLSLGDFEQYGKEFLDHLKLKRLPLEPLRDLCFIDSPGLIDHAGAPGDLSRGYDFPAVVREFACFADLIIFFFDPDRPGTTGESLRIFNDALSDVMYKTLIVFNKVDTFEDVRDFARTYGALCWNLSRIMRTKDMPHIFCTYLEELASRKQRQIDLADFDKSTHQLKQEVRSVGSRRRSNMIGSLLDSTRGLRVHATVCESIGFTLLYTRLILWTGGLLLLFAGLWGLVVYRASTYAVVAEVIAIALGIGILSIQRWLLRQQLNQQISRLDWIFNRLFQRELLEQNHHRFLQGIWETVKPKTEQFLRTVGPGGIPSGPWWRSKIRRLRRMSDEEIPRMLGTLQQPLDR